MYKIIGVDQQEYGPSTAEEIRQWIAEGRANGQTLVQLEGSKEWKPLASFPEFAGLSYTGGTTPRPPVSAPPIQTPAAPVNRPAIVLPADIHLSISDCMNHGWHLLMQNFWLLFPATLLVCGIRLFLSMLPVLGVLAFLFTGVFYGGLYIVFLKRIRGEPASVGEAFSGFGENFTQLLLVGFISLFLTVIGLFFCVVPGIFLFVAWSFAIPLVADKKLGFWDAMQLSRKVVTRHWFQIAILLLLCFLPVILFAGYSNIVTTRFLYSLIDSGQLDPSLFMTNPTQFMAQMTNAAKLMQEKFMYLVLSQQILLLFIQPFGKAVLMHAYEVLFNPRPKPPA